MNRPGLTAPGAVRCRMILFVAGDEPNSRRARENIRAACSEKGSKRYDLQVVDVFDDFQTALDYDIMVTPALVVLDPPPRVTLLGDLSDTEKLHAALGLI